MIENGTWRLSHAVVWDEEGNPIPSPYGDDPMGTLTFHEGRMLAALCTAAGEAYSSYGGRFVFVNDEIRTTVDMASDASRIGSVQVRRVRLAGNTLVLIPPMTNYPVGRQQRELHWARLVPAT